MRAVWPDGLPVFFRIRDGLTDGEPEEGLTDAVLLGRELLRNAYFARHAARELGGVAGTPPQYHRAA